MNERLSRRQFARLAAVAGGATVIGFDRGARAWVTRAEAQTHSFQDVPELDGTLRVDEVARKAIAVDYGNIFHRVPAAVLRPGSVQDIVRMVRYANRHALKIAIKGDGHSRYGQTQAEAGIVIDSKTLNAVRVRSAHSMDAQPGAFWADVVTATLARGLTPRVMPATCLAITVGGTLSVGGIGTTSHNHGAVVDTVTELDVVTGDGRLVTCSPNRERELFDMVLAGLGQCAIIVRARMPLVPAPSHVLLHELTYADLDKYLADQSRMAADGRFESQRGTMTRNSKGEWRFTIEVGKFFSHPNEPSLASLEAGLRFDSAAAPVRMTYRDCLFRFEARTAGAASNRPSPFITMWIPVSATRDYLANILTMPPDVAALPRLAGSEAFGCYPINTGRFTRPLFKVPGEDQAFAMWLFRSVPPGDPMALSALMTSNRELLAKMTAVGGKRYGPYSMVLSPAEWAEHFGPDVWRRLSAAKKTYDPNAVLSPEPAMFAARPDR
jgi:FAD/FMN-containing dehydrogenase